MPVISLEEMSTLIIIKRTRSLVSGTPKCLQELPSPYREGVERLGPKARMIASVLFGMRTLDDLRDTDAVAADLAEDIMERA